MLKKQLKLTNKTSYKALCYIFLLGVILNINLVSALEIDNWVTYEKEDKIAVFENIFGLGDVIGKAELTSHVSPYITRSLFVGANQVVMYYEFYDWKDKYENGLGEVIFTDINTGEEIDKEYKFVYAVYKDVEVPIYKEVCVKEFHNETMMDICHQELDKYETKQELDYWEDLNTNEIPKEKITIGIMTDVYTGDYIDAVWDIAGKKVKKHAAWDSDLDTNLLHCWTFDDDDRSGSTVIDTRGAFTGIEQADGTNYGGAFPTGIIGQAANFSKASVQNITMNDQDLFDDILNSSYNLSFSFWVNVDTANRDGAIFGKGLNTPNGFFAIHSTSTEGIWVYWEANDGNRYREIGVAGIPSAQWVHIGISYNGTVGGENSTFIYVNGAEVRSTMSISSFQTSALENDEEVWFGTGYNSPDPFSGAIDEFVIWNRTLSAAEFSTLYDSGNGMQCSFVTPDNTNPNVTIQSPENITYNTPINYSITAIDNVVIDSCWFTINGGTSNESLLNTTSNDVYNRTAGGVFSDGGYLAEFYCNDSSNNVNNTENIAFAVDTTFPEVNITNPQNISYTTNQTVVNITYIEANVDKCWYSLDDGVTNSSGTTCGDNFTDVPSVEGANVVIVYINDTLGQGNHSTNISYYQDSIFPDINITSPTNHTNSTDNTLDVNFNYFEANVDSCWYSNDSLSENTTLPDCDTNITDIIWAEGQHNVTVWINDTSNSVNSSYVTFTIDTTFPTINITTPQNNSLLTDNTIDVEYFYVEPNCNYVWYSNDSYDANISLGCGNNITNVTWSEGQHDVTVYINDSVNQMNESSVTFYIDTFNPSINITFPSNNTNTTNTNLDVNFTYSESDPDTCWWTEDRGGSNTTLADCDTNITTQTWIPGDHTVIVYINDTSNNVNSSSIFFTIDTGVQNISLTPLGDVVYHIISTNLTINWTAEDPFIDTCLLQYAGVNHTVNCSANGTTFNTTSYLNRDVILFVNDTLGNTNSTSMSWEYKVFENTKTFNPITIEGATETFTLNFSSTTLLQVSQVNITYNGTSTSSPYVVTGDEVIAQTDLTIPNIAASNNLSFYWNVTFSDDSISSSAFTNQSVLLMKVDNCSENSNLMYNFTMLDEETKTNISDSVMEISVNLWDVGKTQIIVNFSKKYTNINPAQICINQSLLANTNYSSYTIVKYTANDTLNNITYATEYHNRFNETISNSSIPINVKLYTLDSDDSTAFRLTFRDASYVLAPNILVNLYRQYIEDNDFKLVEAPLTDSDGQTILNLVKNTIIYNMVMTDEAGNIVATFNRITAFCQDFTIGECTINLNAETIGGTAYDYNSEFDISITPPVYSNTTQLISLDFVTGDLLPKTIRMDVVRNNDFGNRSVCSGTLTSASGTVSCDVSDIVETDQFLFIDVFVDGEQSSSYTINLNADALSFGILNGAFYAFLLILLLITLFMEDKQVLVVSLGIGWVIVLSLGLLRGALVGSASAGIWLLVSIGIFLWKLNQEERI